MKYSNCYLIPVAAVMLASCESYDDPVVSRPILNIGQATEITRTTATLNAVCKVSDRDVVSFRYSKSLSMADYIVAELTEDNVSAGSYMTVVSNLEPGTTYYYCACVTADYNYLVSDVLSFTTYQTSKPTFNAPKCSNITEAGFTVVVETKDKGGQEVYDLGFYLLPVNADEIATETQMTKGNQYSVTITPDLADWNKSSAFSTDFTDLIPGQRYAVCAYGISGGRGLSPVVYVETIKTDKPKPSDCIVSDSIQGLSSMLYASARILSIGTSAVTECGFVYSAEHAEPDLDNAMKVECDLNDDNTFNHIFTDLEAGKMYYFRAYAVNAAGVDYSNTPVGRQVPEVKWQPDFGQIQVDTCTSNSVSLRVELLDTENDFMMLSQGFCCIPASSGRMPVYSDNGSFAQYSSGTASATINGLADDTEYIVRAFALCAGGYFYSEPLTVTTDKRTPSPFDIDIIDIY